MEQKAEVTTLERVGEWERFRAELDGETLAPKPTPDWQDRSQLYRFSIRADGTSRDDWWRSRLAESGHSYSVPAQSLLLHRRFTVSTPGRIDIIIVRGEKMPADALERLAAGVQLPFGWEQPRHDVACLLREKLTTEHLQTIYFMDKMIVMHPPLADHKNDKRLLCISASDDRNLHANSLDNCLRPRQRVGYVFVESPPA